VEDLTPRPSWVEGERVGIGFPVITLAIDTSEARGCVAVLREGLVAATRAHRNSFDYSAWLLPAVESALGEASTKMESLDLLAVCTGPGSFTGLRVGLTAVKAWAEVYGKPVVGVSRLEAIARLQPIASPFLVASYDAQRGQLFAALYRNANGRRARLGEEMVIPPGELVSLVDTKADRNKVTWVCLDIELVSNAEGIAARIDAGDEIVHASVELAPQIGILAEDLAARGRFSDALTLDANYIRRSDAEIFWKGPRVNVR
jgi:tRNA threonylcarbamoyladenosine biosynthesis protein TsaB